MLTKQTTMEEVNEYIKKHYPGIDFRSLITFKENTSPSLTENEKEEKANYLESLIKKHHPVLGDFSYSINTKMNHSVSLYFIDFTIKDDAHFIKLPLYKNGGKIGETCDYCKERLRCLFSEDALCFIDDQDNGIRKGIQEKAKLASFDSDKMIEILKEEGFHSVPFLGIVPTQSTWEKENMRVVLP